MDQPRQTVVRFPDGAVVVHWLDDDVVGLVIDMKALRFLVSGEVGPSGRVLAAGLRTRAGDEIVTTDLRTAGVVPILRNVATHIRLTMPGGVMSTAPRTEQQRKASLAALRRSAQSVRGAARRQQPQRRERVRGEAAVELRRQVVEMYRELVAAGDRSPRLSIAQRLNYTPEHIGRLLVQARNNKELGPAETGRAGEKRRRKR